MKRTLTPAFNPRAVRSLESAIADMVASLVDQIEPGVPIEFVQAVAARLPVYVAARVLGLTDVDLDEVGRWVNALEALTRVETFDELLAAAGQFATMNDYMVSELQRKRTSPGDDLMSIMLRTELNGQPLNEAQMLSHLSTLISNGGTTRVLLASAVELLARHPRERELIVTDPDQVDHAIEEVLRVAPPARGFARLVLQDTEIRGQQATRVHPVLRRQSRPGRVHRPAPFRHQASSGADAPLLRIRHAQLPRRDAGTHGSQSLPSRTPASLPAHGNRRRAGSAGARADQRVAASGRVLRQVSVWSMAAMIVLAAPSMALATWLDGLAS